MIADIALDIVDRHGEQHAMERASSESEHHPIPQCLFDLLPFELLIHVFSFAVEADPDSVVALSLVCSKWYEGVRTTPTLWQHLKLSDTPAKNFDPDRAQARSDLWTRRSGRLPLEIEIESTHHDTMLPMLSYTLSALDRWRSLKACDRAEFKWKSSGFDFGGRSDDEEGMALIIGLQPKRGYSSDVDEETSQTRREPTSTETFSPEKGLPKEIHVKGVRSLPKPGTLTPFANISALGINNMGWKDMPLHQCIHFLEAFPALAYLTLTNRFVQDPEHDTSCQSTQPVLLPQLRSLTLSIASIRCLLSHITTPALERLSLVYINSSMEYDHPTAYAPGDSDDEAQDFSRSPWTDRATGMGLRSLYARCTPPLKELVMDFADLRTKDWKWAFGVMTELRTLSVVASDMSDKVMAALAVKHINPESVAGGAVVPLPRLTKLHLDKCQKISGDVVLAMLESRERAAAEGLVSKFETIETLECYGVTTEHAARMRKLLNRKNVKYRPAVAED